VNRNACLKCQRRGRVSPDVKPWDWKPCPLRGRLEPRVALLTMRQDTLSRKVGENGTGERLVSRRDTSTRTGHTIHIRRLTSIRPSLGPQPLSAAHLWESPCAFPVLRTELDQSPRIISFASDSVTPQAERSLMYVCSMLARLGSPKSKPDVALTFFNIAALTQSFTFESFPPQADKTTAVMAKQAISFFIF
jgi:hypothetical protein